MTQEYCDILPADNGWVFVSEGYHSASFPCYDLALDAAAAYREQRESEGARIVLRSQTLCGGMSAVAPPRRARSSASENAMSH